MTDARLAWRPADPPKAQILSVHYEDQLRGAHAELDELGELALQEADATLVVALHDRIRESECAIVQTDTALAYAQRRLAQLEGVER